MALEMMKGRAVLLLRRSAGHGEDATTGELCLLNPWTYASHEAHCSLRDQDYGRFMRLGGHDYVRLCSTLEPPRLHHGTPNVASRTCIPEGYYPVALRTSPTFTPRYGTPMPYVMNVPARSGILIHPGNTVADTQGCILVGTALHDDPDTLYDSRRAFDTVMAVMHTLDALKVPLTLIVTG